MAYLALIQPHMPPATTVQGVDPRLCRAVRSPE